MFGELPPRFCGSYRPGHVPHPIQVRLGGKDNENAPVAGRLVTVDQEGTLVVDVEGTAFRLWNHEPERLRILAARNADVISLQLRWHLLRTRSQSWLEGWFCFSVCDADDPGRAPCPTGPPPHDLADLLQERGGFFGPADELYRRLGRSPESP